jgi:8-oxo-dGTP pyrophosphatase MutT (NUDIX family)
MKTETSAGGVVVRKIRGDWHVLLISDMNAAWTFPKGTIEKGEAAKDTAIREIREEVGLSNLTFHSELSSVRYNYKKNGPVRKTVHYFLFIKTHYQKLICQKSEGIRSAAWVSLGLAGSMIGYHDTNISLLEKAERILSV